MAAARTSDARPAPARVAVVTGSRADFGLLENLCARLATAPWCDLRVVATGMHLLAQHGDTVQEVAQRFALAARVPLAPDEDSRAGMARAVARGTERFVEVFTWLAPRMVVVLGDRTEACGAALAARYLGLQVAHLHGGDRSGSDVDDFQRDVITRAATLHFPATALSAARLRALSAEGPITVTGAPGLDRVLARDACARADVARRLHLPEDRPWQVVLHHPCPQDAPDTTRTEFRAVLASTLAAGVNDGAATIVILPNNDAGHRAIVDEIASARASTGLHVHAHLERDVYLDLLAHAAVLVGNSSGGIIEGHSLRVPVVNIGKRQAGRERDPTVVDCPAAAPAVTAAIRHACTDPELARLRARPSIYGDGRAAERIVEGIRLACEVGAGAAAWDDPGARAATPIVEAACS